MRINLNISFTAVLIFFCILLCNPDQLIGQIDFSNRTFKDTVDYRTFQKTKGVTTIVINGQDSFNALMLSSIGTKDNFSLSQFESEVNFSRTQFDAEAHFLGARFASDVNFTDSRFDSVALFTFTQFSSGADFTRARFSSRTSFAESQFDSVANFYNSRFDSLGFFAYTQFSSGVIFYGTQFSRAFFGGATFYSFAVFTSARFDSVSDFIGTRFSSSVDFRNANFNSMTYFSGVYLNKKADFNGSEFHGEVSFSHTVLPDYLDFREVKHIDKNIDFTHCILDSIKKMNKSYHCKIALSGSDIDKISINMELFELWFPDETYEQKISLYEKVLKKLEKDGFKESYEILDIEYRKFKLENNGLSLLADFNEWWWNFGYNPENVFYYTVVVFLTFFHFLLLFFHCVYDIYGVDFLHIEKWRIYKKRKFPYEESREIFVKIFHFILYSLLYIFHVFIYATIVFFGLKLDLDKFEKRKTNRTWKYYSGLFLLLFFYFSGLFCTAYIVHIIFK